VLWQLTAQESTAFLSKYLSASHFQQKARKVPLLTDSKGEHETFKHSSLQQRSMQSRYFYIVSEINHFNQTIWQAGVISREMLRNENFLWCPHRPSSFCPLPPHELELKWFPQSSYAWVIANLSLMKHFNKQTLALRQASEKSASFLFSFFCDG